jgi:hypothetical protein
MMHLVKIISGGQTGADQGALDGAIACAFPHGGAIPAGRMTEAGPLPMSYAMEELASHRYMDRTIKNVKDGDGTLILSNQNLTGGSALTYKTARKLAKPHLHIDFRNNDVTQAVNRVNSWLQEHQIQILNVAGPRASSDPEIYGLARELVISLLRIKMRNP